MKLENKDAVNYLSDYYFNHHFYNTAKAAFSESAALERQWWKELEEALTGPVDKLQLTTEMAEYVVHASASSQGKHSPMGRG